MGSLSQSVDFQGRVAFDALRRVISFEDVFGANTLVSFAPRLILSPAVGMAAATAPPAAMVSRCRRVVSTGGNMGRSMVMVVCSRFWPACLGPGASDGLAP